MKKIFTLSVILIINISLQSQSTVKLSDLVPVIYLHSINENLTVSNNTELKNILSNSQFFITNPEPNNRMGSGLVKDYTLQFWNGSNWQNDSSEVYTYNQNNLLEEIKIRNWSGNGWLDKYRYNRYYDSALRINLIIEQDNSTGSWVDSLKKEYYYNGQGQLSTSTTYRWNSPNWENLRLTTSTYNNNLHIQDINQNWRDGAWENSGRTTYTYNSYGNPTSSVLSIWLFGTWINLLQIVLSYNSDGLLEEFKLQWWNFITGWDNLTRILFYYDNNFNIVEGLAQDWNSSTSSWIDYSRITSTYNPNNLLFTDLKELWTFRNFWVNDSFWTYYYNTNSDRTEELKQSWNGENWINSTKELFTYIVTSVEEIDQTPEAFKLLQNYPNPFNPSTIIRFSLPAAGYATLKIYNALGEEVIVLLDKELTIGTYEVEWDAEGLNSGIYFYQLSSNGYVETKKMIMLK